MQAIRTRYLGPTNTKGARVVATAQAGRLVIPWDYALDQEDNHRAAAMAFIHRWGWEGDWVSGALDDCYVHTCLKRYQTGAPECDRRGRFRHWYSGASGE